ncbi:hypothetical protein BKA64DRAFT_699581 [Cadophora sp. MPI-SDFR-AT-0126]|nr:hypothetical protein BKA64DRAFT_699581 [Leotiomycetes sp. MPI-SDFR-AT-0126]
MKLSLLVTLLSTQVSLAWASTFSPARPPAIPLAVKSPYMSTWLEVGKDGGSGGNLAGYWPRFWAGSQPGPVASRNGAVTAWVGFIKVDGTAYTWMGDAYVNGASPPLVTQDFFEYTSQRSTFIMNIAGKLTMDATFISPLTPTGLKRQSIIGTYLYVTVASRDGAKHDVQLYADTSAEWVNPTHN